MKPATPTENNENFGEPIPEKRPIRFGLLEGKGWIADDFDAPLPDDLQALFEGRDDPEW